MGSDGDREPARPEPGDVGGGPSLKDRRLEERAIRERWPLRPEVRLRILKRLVGYIDPETDEGATAAPRTVIAASRAVLSADRLNLDERRLDLAEGRGDGDRIDVDVIDRAERIREQRQGARETENVPECESEPG